MACGFGAEPLREVLGEGDGQGPRIRYVEEPEPLGTAGPLRLAADEGLLGGPLPGAQRRSARATSISAR